MRNFLQQLGLVLTAALLSILAFALFNAQQARQGSAAPRRKQDATPAPSPEEQLFKKLTKPPQ